MEKTTSAEKTSTVAKPNASKEATTTSFRPPKVLDPSPTSSPSNSSPAATASNAPPNYTETDVYLNVPQLSVGKIELEVDNLSADINLNANVAQLVQINAGVKVAVQKVNITITEIDAQLELVVRLGHLVDIVQRVFSSLDLNPLLISALNNVTSIVGEVIGVVDGLLGSVTNGGKTLNFIIDNLGNIVQEVTDSAGQVANTIVGDYLTNMTFTGTQKTLSGGLLQKTYLYKELNSLVDIVVNQAGQIVQATVQKGSNNGS
ncbi:MAG: hypothetical protein GOMPHAMPRED_005868 [Gomphillus americanus]|uniref:Uncharacterized protein n=1 Tax=Gomphillus americanus TaxID=1940652 RepID=A0A8H3IXN7_9LECA|nr:MAG: hypothetical protein GOMPHAMPRED_005868 [Gomphillus americanus]